MIRHRCLRYPRFEGDTLNTRFREDRDRQGLRILKVNQSKLVRQLLVEISEEECWIEIVGGEVTQESEIRQLVQKTARDLVVVTADKPGRRPAICELLKELLAPRISAVTPHENHAVCYGTSLGIHADEIESSKHRLLAALRMPAQIASSSSVVVAARQIGASSVAQHSILRRGFFKASEETIFGIIRGTAKPTGEVS